ncbi:hypothetical protein PMLGA01_020011900 [Plasmodium malariae]|uniref:Uncharacterized protein n=1 Tax=Plasmodium malariae TaxID=5858 RepID=A0A1C3K9V2_PLAMA|nr:hypothetical protein PMLGA01_020011900 [Plasmodium malariae]
MPSGDKIKHCVSMMLSFLLLLLNNGSSNYCNRSSNYCNRSSNYCNRSSNYCNRSSNYCNRSSNYCNRSSNYCNKYSNYKNSNEKFKFEMMNRLFLGLYYHFIKEQHCYVDNYFFA